MTAIVALAAAGGFDPLRFALTGAPALAATYGYVRLAVTRTRTGHWSDSTVALATVGFALALAAAAWLLGSLARG